MWRTVACLDIDQGDQMVWVKSRPKRKILTSLQIYQQNMGQTTEQIDFKNLAKLQ